jgi:hypothetical protein
MRYAHDLQSRDWKCDKHELLEGLSIAAGLTTTSDLDCPSDPTPSFIGRHRRPDTATPRR